MAFNDLEFHAVKKEVEAFVGKQTSANTYQT